MKVLESSADSQDRIEPDSYVISPYSGLLWAVMLAIPSALGATLVIIAWRLVAGLPVLGSRPERTEASVARKKTSVVTWIATGLLILAAIAAMVL